MKKVDILRVSTIDQSLIVHLRGQNEHLREDFVIEGAACHTTQMKERREELDYKLHHIPFNRDINLSKDIVALIKLYWLLRKLNPKIVHSITPKAGLLSMIASYLAGVPVRIHTFTGLIFPYKKGLLKSLLVFFDKVLCFFATDIFPESDGVRKQLLEYKITNKSLTLIANGNVNGVDLEFFDNSLKHELTINGICKQDFVYIFIGRLVGDKGVNELVASFIKVLDKYSNSKLILLGEFEEELDPLDVKTKRIIMESPSILTSGWTHDVRPYIQNSNCLVFPSHREGFPNVLLQCGAMKLPIIATNIVGNQDIIQHGCTGILVEKGSIAQLTQAMLAVRNDGEREKRVENLYNNIVTKWSTHIVWEAHKQLYQSKLKR